VAPCVCRQPPEVSPPLEPCCARSCLQARLPLAATTLLRPLFLARQTQAGAPCADCLMAQVRAAVTVSPRGPCRPRGSIHVLLKYPAAVGSFWTHSSEEAPLCAAQLGPGFLCSRRLTCCALVLPIPCTVCLSRIPLPLGLLVPMMQASAAAVIILIHPQLPVVACSCTDSSSRMPLRAHTQHCPPPPAPAPYGAAPTLHHLQPTRMPLVHDSGICSRQHPSTGCRTC